MNNLLTKSAALVLITAAVSGCARNTYMMEGSTYTDPRQAISHQKSSLESALSTVTPLKAPVSSKKLIIAIPSRATLHTIVHAANAKTNPNVSQRLLDYLVDTDVNNVQFLVDGIRKKNIYATVETIETGNNMNLAAGPATDTMFYFSDPTRRVFQWYLMNQKNGKQVLAVDASLPTLKDRVDSQLNSITAFALQ